MTIELSEYQEETVSVARSIASERLAPVAMAYDRDETFPTDNLKAIGSAGLLGINIDPVYGGRGLVSWAMCALCASWPKPVRAPRLR